MKYLLWFCLFVCPVLAEAHGYWLEIKGSGKPGERVRIRIRYGEIDIYGVRKPESDPVFLQNFRVFVLDDAGHRRDLTLQPGPDFLETGFIPEKEGYYRIRGINEDLPVVDRSAAGGINVRPVEYLCAGYVAGAGKEVSGSRQRVDLELSRRDRLWVIRPWLDGQTVAAGTRLRIFDPENWEKLLETDAGGEAAFFAPRKGMYVIRLDWVDPTPGSHQGVAYRQVRHRCNYCLFVR